MNLLIQVPGTITSFTDNDLPYGIVFYQIGMSNPSGCNPAKKSDPDYSSSRSNMEQLNISGIQELNENKLFTIYLEITFKLSTSFRSLTGISSL
jgi:hypothetical protein